MSVRGGLLCWRDRIDTGSRLPGRFAVWGRQGLWDRASGGDVVVPALREEFRELEPVSCLRPAWRPGSAFRLRDPEVRAAFDRVLAPVSALGPVEVLPEKIRMRCISAAFMPRRRWFNGHLVLARHIDSPRFLRIHELSPRNVLHTFRLASPADVDAEFVTWLAEAYRVGFQEHPHR
jgi:hypothetical protein